jgi:peroxiredoxin
MLRGLLVAAVTVALALTAWLALRPASPGLDARADSPARPDGRQTATATPGPRPLAESRRAIDEALKDLDLIRPSRTKAAENFTAPLLGGSTFRLSEQRGKPVFVNFWATWCPPCREEMPAMERLWRAQKARGLVMVAVSLDTDPKVVAPYVKEHGLTFPVVFDPKLEIANAYGVRALPATFLVDREGNLQALALGPRAWDNKASHSLIQALTRN